MEKKTKSKQKNRGAHKPRQNGPRNRSQNTPNLPRANFFGMHAVREAWLNPARNFHALYLTEAAYKEFESVLTEAKKLGLKRPEPAKIDKDTLEKVLPKGAVHQGIAASCQPLEDADVQDFVIRASTQERCVVAILDQVTDPHNVGAILRSASAFGLDGIIMQKKHAPALDGVLAKTACGAVDAITVATAVNLSRALEALQEVGFTVIGFDEHSAESIKSVPVPDKSVIIVGSEGDGMRRLLKERCDFLVTLPTQGKIRSLNVSNAAAIAFYALTQH